MALSGSLRTVLPGFGKPINCYNEEENGIFPSPLNPSNLTLLNLLTLREITMMQVMNQITDKPEWNNKVFDEAITKKWEEEALTSGRDITREMLRWVIDELKWKASLFKETHAVRVYDGDVVKSDSALSESFKIALQEAVRPLEDVPDKKKDWHPGSDDMVLDLVHPSLFPLIYGKSKVLEYGTLSLQESFEKSGEGVVVPNPSTQDIRVGREPNPENAYSAKFQWLPCEVDISSGKANITSYINNLHPQQHKALYALIEEVIDASIPMWEITLGPLDDPRGNLTRMSFDDENLYEGQEIVPPEPGPFNSLMCSPKMFDLLNQFTEPGLQVIVKLANIILTPEKPKYAGGSWHIEGQLNEHICASALYYYSNENITTSSLAFRQQSNYDTAHSFSYEQDFHDWLPIVFGLENWCPSIQVLGGVETREGRLLTFPNILQHQVQPFSLADAEKPGHRKILALFLVDPKTRILSTANVPPQQVDWWKEQLERVSALDKFPNEIKDEIFNRVSDSFPITLDEAKEYRLELMEERKKFTVRQKKDFESLTISLCEH